MNILSKIRNSKTAKILTCISYFGMLFQQVFRTETFAANGPQQPEFQGPAVDQNAQLVDPFTGDFSYAIDILGEAGIPMNLNYAAGISMEQEASWVGLGWNLNPGSIVRNMRGFPDDFNGDVITEATNIRPNITAGINLKLGFHEVIGLDSSAFEKAKDAGLEIVTDKALIGDNYGAVYGSELGGVGTSLVYNNYNGFSVSTFASGSKELSKHLNLGLDINSGNASSFGGVGISPSYSIDLSDASETKREEMNKITLGASFTSNTGLKNFSAGGHFPKTGKHGYEPGLNLMGYEQAYTPVVSKEFLSQSYTFNGSLGVEAFLADAAEQFTGYYNSTYLKQKYTTTPAYGYMYLKNDEDNAISQDINRDGDIPISPSAPALPIGYYTYDVFSVSAPGVGGSFRAYRNDIGYMQDKEMRNISIEGSLGLEFAGGATYKTGIDIQGVFGQSTTKPFTYENELAANTEHSTNSDNYNDDETAFQFRFIGENVRDNSYDFVTNFGSSQAVEPNLESNFFIPVVKNTKLLYDDEGYNPGPFSTDPLPSFISLDKENTHRQNRVPATKSIAYYTQQDVSTYYNGETKYEISDEAEAHHIARIVITAEDGTKYVFGLAAYNNKQYEYTFNVGGDRAPETAGSNYLVNYDPSTQKTLDNKSGKDYFFKKTEMPAYAYTYLLTEILSPDYVDMTSDGPSDDDLGNYVLYTYGNKNPTSGKYEPNIPAFKWRTPNTDESDYAAYSEGMRHDYNDDRANFIYGEKEVWYLSKAETKTHVAYFMLTDRQDGYTTLNEDGGIGGAGTPCLKALEKIELYSKFDEQRVNEMPDPPGTPELEAIADIPLIPLKVINFQYSYDLCDQALTNISGGGKLTLTSLNTIYYNSNKSKYNAYSFEYNNSAITIPGYGTWDPKYDPQMQDRWGNIQIGATGRPNRDFPYTRQDDRTMSDQLAGLWNISKINLPDGGYIEVDYEADDYAFVQHKKASRMFNVLGAFEEPNLTTHVIGDFTDFGPRLYDFDAGASENQFYLCFELEEPILGDYAEAVNNFMYKYLYDYDLNDDIGKNLNFRFYLGTDNDDFCDESELENDEKFEFIEGYASVDYAHCGLAKSSAGETGYSLGYIRLNPAKFAKLGNYESILNFDPINLTIDEAEINPITKAAWMYTMMNAPRNVTEGCESTDISDASDATYFILDLINHLDMLATIGDMFMNPNEKMKSLFIGSDFDPDQSVIRLHEPDGVKIGGGYRVKEVRYGDNWNTMTAGAERESIYGTKYVYTTVSGKQTISSGVAAWEPQSGGEENPYRKPSTYSHLSDTYKYEYYINQPYGEVFFPSPIVGYSRVEEIPFGKFPDDDPMTSDASYQEVGKTVSWFYTAYDYPTKVSHTEVFPINNHLDPSGIVSFFADVSSELFAASQGYTIESNDMHGKPKRVQISNANGSAIISDTEYEYFESPDGSLNNIVPVLNKFGRINEDELGVTYDVYADYRKNNTYNLGGNVKLGVDGTGVVFSPSVYPQIIANYSTSAFTVITKNVQRNGIIKSVTTTTNGSKVTSSNLAFDGSNGMALIVEQQNEFDDKYYSVTIPTHFIYDELGYASSNQGYKFKHDDTHTEIDLASSKLLYDAAQDFVPGDKIFLSITGAGISPSYTTAWVYQKETAGVAEGKYLVDAYGFPIDFTGATLIIGRVFESGKKNMAGAAAMQVICKENPIVTIEGHEQLQLSANSGIIDATATEYSDIWRIFCTDDIEPDISCECNDYINQAATDLSNIFHSLISTGNLVTDPTQVLLYEHTYAGADYYYHGCTPEFLEAFGFSMDGVYNVVWSSEIVGDNLECKLIWLRNPGEPQICSFDLGTADDVMNLQNAYGSDLLGDMNYEMIVPSTAVVGSCGPIDEFTLNATYYNPSTPGYINLTLSCESFTCFPLRNCNLKYTPPVFCMGSEGDHANPYLLGIRGNWQPKIAFKYLTDRTPEAYFTDASPSGNEAAIRDQGLYTSFTPFWSPNALAVWEKNTDPKWTWTAQTMLIDPLAHTASVKDALDIYSSSTYNLNHVAAELVANNAKYNQIAFENYEDDFYLDVANPSDCHSKHFDINPDVNGIITRQFAHSGNFSMRLAPGGYADYTHTLSNPEENRTNFPEPGYIIESKDCMPDFAPGLDEAGTKYLMTFWYRDPIPKLATGTSTSLNVEITLDGDNLITSAIQIGDEIERWRRVELEFTMPDPMPTGDPNFVLKIENTNTGIGKFLYIDDIRIIPSESQAMGYVYDFITQRLVAELDDNHFTTFYEYDNEGNLIRIKKETERGIYTIQEARYNTPKSE